MAVNSQIAAVKRVEGTAGQKARAQTEVNGLCSECMGHLTGKLLQDTMEMVGRAGIEIREAEEDERGTPGTWVKHLSATYGDLNGGFSIVLRDEEEAGRAIEALSEVNFREGKTYLS